MCYSSVMRNELSEHKMNLFMSHVAVVESGCHEWTARRDAKGYGAWRVNDRSRQLKAHRVAYMIAHGEIDDDKLCLHMCDNRACVNPAHLYLGTSADNTRDMLERDRCSRVGMSLPGSRNGRAKLGESDVIKIRELYASGVNQCAIGRMCGVTHDAVHMIVKRKSWKHVPG